MSTCCRRFSTLLLTTIFFINLFTSQSLFADSTTENQRIVVTATRTAQIADETLAPVIVIDREQIDNTQAMDIADVLRFHAGLDIGRYGGPGQTTSLFLRGTDSNHTLVMIDGVKINPATIGGAALHNISPDMIERIEIVKGPRSTLYGSEAIGGVINIITRRDGKAGFKIKAGSFNSQQFSAETHHTRDKFSSGFNVSMLSTDGFAIQSASNVKRGHDNTSFSFYSETSIALMDLGFSHWQSEGNTEYLDFLLTPLDQDYKNSSTAVEIGLMPRDNWTSVFKLSQISDEIDQNQSTDFAHTGRTTIDWQNDIQLDLQLLSMGIMLSNESASAESFGTIFDEDTRVNAVYFQDDITSGKHHSLIAARYTDHETFDQHTTWDFEYGLRLSNKTRLTAAAGTGFRAPDSTDRFGSAGNLNLKSETSLNKEVGIKQNINNHHSISLRYFDNQISDMIEWDSISGLMQNIGKVNISGTEIELHYQQDNWELHLSAITQDPLNEITGETLVRRAKDSLSATLNTTVRDYKVSTNILLSGKRKDFDSINFDPIENPGYMLANISFTKPLNKELIIRCKIENLFDKDYTLVDGYNTAERSIFLEFSNNLN